MKREELVAKVKARKKALKITNVLGLDFAGNEVVTVEALKKTRAAQKL